MIRMFSLGSAVFVLAVMGLSPAAHALHLEFTGTIDGVIGTPPAPFADIMAGDTWTVSVDVDDAAMDQNVDADAGSYLLTSLTLTIDGAMESTTIGQVAISNGPDNDTFAVLASLPTPIPDYTIGVTLMDSTESVFSSDALPSSVDPADFDFDVFSINGLTGGFTVTGSLAPVPAPASIAPLLVGGALAIGRRRR